MTTSAGNSGERSLAENCHRHLVIQWPSIQMREWAIKRSSIASLWEYLDAPFHLVCCKCTISAGLLMDFKVFIMWKDALFLFVYSMFLVSLDLNL